MIDDEDDYIESTSDKFPMTKISLPSLSPSTNILCISVSRKNIYIVTDHSELIILNSVTFEHNNQALSLVSKEINKPNNQKENLTKIWTDREGIHCIIKYNSSIFYYNCVKCILRELNKLKLIEISAVGFDDYLKENEKENYTGKFLVVDHNNKIYECSLKIQSGQNPKEIEIIESVLPLNKILLKDWDSEDDDDYEFKPNKNEEIIYGIKFMKTSKQKLTIDDDYYYIIAVTRTKIYQFIGPGQEGFQQTFAKYKENPMLYNDCCKYFPRAKSKNDKFDTDINILYRNSERFYQFGWKTETGFCFGNFNYSNYLPDELNKFTVIPFAKIDNQGKKEIKADPISVTHTQNHIFLLYNDCLTIISKLTSNIIHTQYFTKEYQGIIYNEFSPNGGTILLYSQKELFQVSLKEENADIWEDYLEVGDYPNVQKCLEKNDKLMKKINRIIGDEEFEREDYNNSLSKYLLSDEKFEMVCLKYLIKEKKDILNLYLQMYLENLEKEKSEYDEQKRKEKAEQKRRERNSDEDILEVPKKKIEDKDYYSLGFNLISTLLIELFLNNSKTDKNSEIKDFRVLIREKRKFLLEGNIIYELLIAYGKLDELVEFASLMGDFEKVIYSYILEEKIDVALERLEEFSVYASDTNSKNRLKDIFMNNCRLFFKRNPKTSVNILKNRFTIDDDNMDTIVKAIINSTDEDTNFCKNDISQELKNKSSLDLKIFKKDDDSYDILSYLKTLIDKPNLPQANNIHNLYIYYLTKSQINQEAIIDYLKRPFIRGKKPLFQFDYAKKIFMNNPPAYALVLALMGKYSEAVKAVLNSNSPDNQKIAKFIAANAPEKLRKKIWIDIFSYNSQNQFQEAVKLIEESKILQIEDVLPYITDTIKIEEFKTQISDCINNFENDIQKLKKDINEYNVTAENIKNDINVIKNKSIEIQFSNCRCDICQEFIKEDKDIYIFPCGHMFDPQCIRECLLDFEYSGIESVHENNVTIDKIFKKLGYKYKSPFIYPKLKPKENGIEEEKKQQEATGGSIFDKFKIIEFAGIKKEEPVQENIVIKKEDINKLEEQLYSILSKQCVLCGDLMAESTQYSLIKPDRIKASGDVKIVPKIPTNWDFI